jgi:hypothetical protein
VEDGHSAGAEGAPQLPPCSTGDTGDRNLNLRMDVASAAHQEPGAPLHARHQQQLRTHPFDDVMGSTLQKLYARKKNAAKAATSTGNISILVPAGWQQIYSTYPSPDGEVTAPTKGG